MMSKRKCQVDSISCMLELKTMKIDLKEFFDLFGFLGTFLKYGFD